MSDYGIWWRNECFFIGSCYRHGDWKAKRFDISIFFLVHFLQTKSGVGLDIYGQVSSGCIQNLHHKSASTLLFLMFDSVDEIRPLRSQISVLQSRILPFHSPCSELRFKIRMYASLVPVPQPSFSALPLMPAWLTRTFSYYFLNDSMRVYTAILSWRINQPLENSSLDRSLLFKMTQLTVSSSRSLDISEWLYIRTRWNDVSWVFKLSWCGVELVEKTCTRAIY